MAYVAAFEPKVIQTYPRNMAKDVPNFAVIKIHFNTDLDRGHILPYVQVYDESGKLIEGDVSYNERTISFSPTAPFPSDAKIRVRIIGDDLSGKDIGIRSVLGVRMRGDYEFYFTVLANPLLNPPKLIYPADQAVIDDIPAFQWEPVQNASFYEIQLSQSNLMNPVIWPVNWDTYRLYDSNNPVVPDVDLEDGIYYWRMRTVDANGIRGPWSPTFIFNLDRQTEGTVSDDDTVPPDMPYFDPVEFDSTYEVIETFPEDGFSNVATNLKTIGIRILGILSDEEIQALQNSFAVVAERVDGDDSDPTLIHEIVEIEDKGYFIDHEQGTTTVWFVLKPLEE